MIRGFCRTNLDEGKNHKWPSVFVEVPRVGDMVRALDSRIEYSILKVCTITHWQDEDGPFVSIELNK